MPCFYLTPQQDDFNQELQICIAEALYDVDSIVAGPGAYTREDLTTLQPDCVESGTGVGDSRRERGSANGYDDADLTGRGTTVQQTRMRACTPG